MSSSRLEGFSDGVMAIIITIMVLEIRPPQDATFAALRSVQPTILAYVLSFVLVGIYWNNHHLLLHATKVVTGGVMWANMHLLFWLSLTPFVTAWVGQAHEHVAPAAVYGLVALMSAVAYTMLVLTIMKANPGSAVVRAIGSDAKGRISIVLWSIGVALAFVQPLLAYAAYALVAAIWLIPDRRLAQIER
jgi:TMEM175 potassium channel family protein